jgi:transcriptional regulator with PAS, ATPase and Fis domain
MNAVEYAANMAETDVLLPEHLPKVFQGKIDIPVRRTLQQILHDVERRIILNMLNNQGTSVTAKKHIAQELGLSLSTLYAKIKSHDIEQENKD